MAQRLSENITSGYLDAAHRMLPQRRKRRIVAYVESYDDIAFWKPILDEFETDEFYFQLMLPSARTLTKGKKSVLLNTLNPNELGRSLIACVDSDLDFLLQGSTATSRKLNENNYVFQTYSYAIENYRCYAGNLHNVCVEATLNDKHLVDFEQLMTMYSEAVYPLFLWMIYFYRRHDTDTFPMCRFNDITRIRHINLHDPDAAIEDVRRRVNHSLADLERKYLREKNNVEALGKELEALGLKPDTTYLYIQGHHLQDNVVMKMLVPVCTVLRREREDQIKQLAEHHTQYHNELVAYQHTMEGVGQVLRRTVGYKELFHYQWLRRDLQRFATEQQKR
ncbi:MAG: DUF4435 domain-containing protein [Prevotellaceae bacterium]|jgi:hypothetical protein|nr:DUF4435 domain-containing protein [Prevotellaceae bacterium]